MNLQQYLNKYENSNIVPPIKDFKRLIQESGLSKAVREANNLYKEKYYNKEKVFNSFESLNEGDLPRESAAFGLIPGKIYTYKYSPKHKDELAYYDINPLMISLGGFKAGGANIEMGINLHFIPNEEKIRVIELLWKVYRLDLEKNFNQLMKEDYSNQKPLPNIYRNAQKIFEIIGHTNIKFARRNYLRNRMRDLQIVEYTDWKYIPLLDSKWFVKATKAEIFEKYYLNKDERKDKEDKKKNKNI